MKRIAMPIAKGKVSDHFEEFEHFLIYDFNDPNCIREEIGHPPSSNPDELPGWFNKSGVTDIFARGISYEEIKKLNHNKIHVFVGVPQKKPEDLLIDYMNRKLETDETMHY